MSVVTTHTLTIELGDVSPSLALLDSVDVAIRDAIVIRNRLEGFTLSETLPNLYYLSGGEFGECVIFAQGTPSCACHTAEAYGLEMVTDAREAVYVPRLARLEEVDRDPTA